MYTAALLLVLSAGLTFLDAGEAFALTESAAVPGAPPAPPWRIERHPKIEGQYLRIGADRVQIGPYRMAEIDHEDDDAFYLRIHEPVVVAPEAPALAPPPQVQLASSRLFDLSTMDRGLPREGQWRNDLAVADVNGDGEIDIASTPPRKSMGRPVVFLGDGHGRWRKWTELQTPALRYDYGSVVAGDFDRDGRTDLAFAMHLRGFTVLRQAGPGLFERADAGLPRLEDVAHHGFSGTFIAWDAGATRRPLLLLLNELLRPGATATPAPTAQVMQWTGHEWQAARAVPAEVLRGGRARVLPADTSLPGLWLLTQGSAGTRIIRHWRQKWTVRPLETLQADCELHAAAAAEVDGDGRPDFAVSCLRLIGDTWWSEVRLLRSRLGALTVQAGSSAQTVSAITFVRLRGRRAGPDLALLDRSGGLQLLSAGSAGDYRRDHYEAAPDWRQGCAGHALRGIDIDHDGRDELLASFAGEASVFDLMAACPSNGGITVWKAKLRADASR